MKNLSIILLWSLMACGQSDSTVAENDEQVFESVVFDLEKQSALLQQSIQTYLKIDLRLPAKRTQSIELEKVLLSIHPLLKKGFLLEEQQDFLTLNPVDTLAKQEILQLLATNDKNYGVGYMQQVFWEDIFAIQENHPEIQIAFLKNSSLDEYRIGGYFNFSKNLLALSVTADAGTVAHELQHFRQYKDLDNDASRLYFGQKRQSCLRSLSTIFAELDATRVQAPYWKDLYQSVDPSLWLEQLKAQQDKGPQFNLAVVQNDLWNANLAYVPNLLKSLKGLEVCPATIQRPIAKLQSQIYQQRQKITAASQDWYIDLHKYVNTAVSNNYQPSDEAQSVWQEKNQAYLEKFHSYLEIQDQDIRDLANQFANRIARSARADLCNRALGFRSLVDSCSE